MEQEKISMMFKEKTVLYSPSSKTWTYDGIDESVVAKLNPELARDINTALEKSVAEYQERIKAAEQKREEENKAKIITALNAWKAEVEQAFKHEGYELRFCEPERIGNNVKSVKIMKDKLAVDVSYSSLVYPAGYWHAQKTNKPWQVQYYDDGYKTVRYGTLEKALAAAKEKLDSKVEAAKARAEANKAALEQEEIIKEDLGKIGLTLRKDTHWGNNKSYVVSKAVAVLKTEGGNKVEVSASFGKNHLEFSNINIVGKLNAEQMMKLVEFVKELNLEVDYKY